MAKPLVLDAGRELDDYVAAFESAHRCNLHADLTEFLPDRFHPLHNEVLCELVRVDLEFGWELGSARTLADYVAQFPELFADPANLQAVAYEEYRLRRQAGQAVSPQDYQAGLGVNTCGWPTLPAASCADATEKLTDPGLAESGPHPGRLLAEPGLSLAVEMGVPGNDLLGFRLVAELGRGSFARVFLARQGELAHRSVALKVSGCWGESHKLAQLQHTNIVPIYSVHRIGELQAVCMPFFGSTTLADVLRGVQSHGLPCSGAALVDLLMERRRTVPGCVEWNSPGSDPDDGSHHDGQTRRDPASIGSLPLLSALTYGEAVLWIGARLADGLGHAHDRGIWHRDIKPANILLADDGQPMLLDFNLSEDVKHRPAAPFVGGTLAYMAPEQMAAIGHTDHGGDARSDLYSLGVILYELLTGRHPFPCRHGAAEEVLSRMLEDRLHAPTRECPGVSPAVQSIVARCLAAQPDRRYQTARQLQVDLEHQLEHRPLRYAREPSWRERVGKWVRRHPRLASAGSMACLAASVLAVLGALLAVRGARLTRLEADAVFQQFVGDLRRAQVQYLSVTGADPERSPALAAACRQALDRFGVLDNSDWRQTSDFTRLPPEKQQRVSGDAGELLFLMASLARLEAQWSSPEQRQQQLCRALDLNRQAESCYVRGDVPGAVWGQQALLMAQLGQQTAARRLADQATHTVPSSTRDLCMLACEHVAEQRYRDALPLWQTATRQDPENVWGWYGLAHCYDRLSKPALAAAGYSACISLKPDYHGWYFSRGSAYLKLREFALAEADFDLVLQRVPGQAEALVNRALARLGAGEADLAVADLTQSLTWGASDCRVYLIRAQARERAGDSSGAKLDRDRGLACKPTDESGWMARGAARAPVDPHGALQDYDQALRCNSRSAAALESKAHLLSERLGETEKAILELDRAIEFSPEHAPAVAARGVLLARLDRDAAAIADAERALAIDLSAATQFQVAGIYALTSERHSGHRPRALSLLSAALRQGYGSDLLQTDPDLDLLRADPQFAQLLEATMVLHASGP